MAAIRVARPVLSCCRLRAFQLQVRNFSDKPSPDSVLLPRLMVDLKNAMRSKDAPRLNVLRAIKAEITNASKTAKPIDSDAKLLALLRKQLASSEKAIEEFTNAKRDELVEKEKTEVAVLQGYVDEIPVLQKEEVDALVDEAIATLKGEGKEEGWKAPFGQVMKAVMAKIAGRPVDQTYVTEKIKSLAA